MTESPRRKIEDKFRGLLEAAPDAMVMVNRQGRIELVNHQTERLFGYTRGELLGQPVETLVPDRFAGAHRSHRGGYFGEPRVRAMGTGLDLYARRKDGTEFPVEISLSPLETEEGLLVTAAIRDVTERRRAQAALEERTRELEETREELVRQERLAALGQLAGGVSHELRNPLGVIANAIYYLKMVLPHDERARRHLTIIEREVQTASRIVGDLLEFGRVNPPARVSAALGDIVRQALERTAVPETIEVVLELADDLPSIRVDPGQVEQVVGNLLRNAIQAMSAGGTLTVRTAQDGDRVVASVEDTGVGIPPDDLERIFQPLFTTKAKGIGLGLAISRRLAEANFGRLTVASEPGRGSRFVVAFPVPGA